MADVTRVSYGVEWNSADVVPGTICGFKKLPPAGDLASRFISTMRSLGHTEVFTYGNGDAWASDYEHPELGTKGDSLNWVDNVNLFFFAGHGASELSVSLASNHFSCRALYKNMRLGVKNLRWLVLSLCDAVIDTPSVDASVTKVWSTPSDGDRAHPRRSLHMACTFIGEEAPGIDTSAGATFAHSVSIGQPIGNAWLDAAFDRSGSTANRPIVIAFGRDQNDARSRRDHGTLADRDLGPVESNWLAWKWRS
jgi:Family of unknown function (DUF6345)